MCSFKLSYTFPDCDASAYAVVGARAAIEQDVEDADGTEKKETNSMAYCKNGMELRISCTNPSICSVLGTAWSRNIMYKPIVLFFYVMIGYIHICMRTACHYIYQCLFLLQAMFCTASMLVFLFVVLYAFCN